MVTKDNVEWVAEHTFDATRCRHIEAGETTVLHCHHYASLYCQLADDAEIFNGRELLRRAAELSFYPVLASYYSTHDVLDRGVRASLAEAYWKRSGMGRMSIECLGQHSAVVRMDHSHVDAGWVKKWSQRGTPVNFIGQGFLAAVMAAIWDCPPGSFVVEENESIVSGAEASRFTVVRK